LLDHEPRRRLLAALADRVVLITASRAPERLAEELATTLVVDAEAVRGIGDVAWFEAIGRPSVADWGEAPILLDAAQDDGLVDDDADDDEE
jgi:hypothetical protein